VRGAIGIGWVGVIAPFVFQAVGIVRADDSWLVNRMPDDAFYYLEIARRMGHGQGFTFDGTHATNGFHPLWQVMLGALATIVPGQMAFVRVALLAGLVCLLAALLLVIRLVWRMAGPGPALSGALLVVHGTTALPNIVDGLEGAVLVLCLSVVATTLANFAERPSSARAALVGVASAFVVLARLDMVVVIWLLPCAMALRTRNGRWIGWWLVGGMIGALWGVWFVVRYHHVLTTSATVKQAEMSAFVATFGGRLTSGFVNYERVRGAEYVRSLLETATQSMVRGGGALSSIVGMALLALAFTPCVAWVRVRFGGRDEVIPNSNAATSQSLQWSAFGFALLTTAVAIGAKASFDLVNAPIWADAWYKSSQYFAVPFAIGAGAWIGARMLARRWPPVGLAAFGAVAFVSLPLTAGLVIDTTSYPRHYNSWPDQVDEAATWIRTNGPQGQYGAGNAGLLGYQLDGARDVVDLDGLVNNYEFATKLARGDSLPELLAATGTDYYVDRITPSALQQFPCATVLWTSSGLIPYPNPDGTTSNAPVHVLDVRECRKGAASN